MMIRNTIAILLVTVGFSLAQKTDIKNAYRIEGGNIALYLDNTWPRTDQEQILVRSGMKGLSLDTLWNMGSVGHFAKEGWKLSREGTNQYKIYKSVSDLSGNLKWDKEVVLFSNLWERMMLQTRATYGYHAFKGKPSVVTLPDGATRFFLSGKAEARNVFLSGTFNNWSTQKTPMTKTDSGWVATVPLQAGKHCYKFIVNGRWLNDNENKLREDDYVGGHNSVYFKTNHVFQLHGYTDASSVVVSGTFNQWNPRELKMQRTADGWSLPVYLNDGTHAYKFIVDKQWMTDPANPETRSDGTGNRNSYLKLGEPITFRLYGYPDAKQVIVAGEFNEWNERELAMRRTTDGWELNYVLGSGNYQYKYIVDGAWMVDPLNSHTGTLGGHQNSIKAVNPNQTFFLKGFTSATSVQLAGNFNDWKGYTMKKTSYGWTIDVFLNPGKCLYKLIVDGKWMIDPGNELWEQNEYGTGNSVLWVGPL